MTYHQLASLHLATILPAFALATALLFMRKGTPLHKSFGKAFLLLMVATASITLFMPAKVGPSIFGHFGFIHALSLLTLYVAPSAYLSARRGDIDTHKKNMIGLYVGGFLLAGAFAFMPGRMLHTWLFG